MKILVLMFASMIAISLCGPFKEAKLERVLDDLEVVLQDLKEKPPAKVEGDFSKMSEIQELMDGLQDEPVSMEVQVQGDLKQNPNEKSGKFTPAMEEMLLHTSNIEEATAEVKAAGGRVSIQLGHDLLIAQVPSDFVAKQNSFVSASAHISSSASSETLSHTKAYWKYREDKLKPQPPVQKWTDKTAPKSFPPQSESPLSVDEAKSPYSLTLTGKIVVLVLMASGKGNLALSSSETNTVVSEVLAGLKFWEDKAAADGVTLSFAMYYGVATIDAEDSSACSSYAACHNVFADPTLQAFGYQTGQAGRDHLAQQYKDHDNADGAYIAFFSKYKQSHFAYAYFKGGPIYMQYSNDGWGPDQIDRVFAHETGHVFNAPDEYTKCQCNTQYGQGSCSDRNSNCKDCTSSQLGCIMDSNDLSNICDHTKKHVGWC